jgi:hypothetical protein
MDNLTRTRPNKTLHTNRRPALGFGLSAELFEAWGRHHIIVRAAVGELPSEVIRQGESTFSVLSTFQVSFWKNLRSKIP